MYSKDIILKERILLNTLNFEFVVVHPFEFCQRKVIEVKSKFLLVLCCWISQS